MEITKINLNSPIKALKEFNILEMKESGGELLIKLANKECYNIFPGQKLMFRRYIYDYNSHNFQISAEVTVLEEDENHIIHTTLPPKYTHMLYCGENDIKYVTGTTVNESGETISYDYHILKTIDDHNLFFQDLNVGDGQEIYIKNYKGETIAVYNDIDIPLKRSDNPATSAECITYIDEDRTCGKKHKKVIEFQYNFLPESVSRNKIIVREFSETIIPQMAYFETKFNPFYWYYIEKDGETPKELDKYGKPVKVCKLYEDTLWETIEDYDKITLTEEYVNLGNTRTVLGVLNTYWDVNIGLSSPMNETTLGCEDNFSTSFIEDIEESLIPDIIDMERVKYSPMIKSDTDENLTIATSLTLNYHFRERVEIKDGQRYQNTLFTSGNVYSDGWYIDPENDSTIWWNGYDKNDAFFNLSHFNSFLSDNAEISDLLGFLNFTDSDVYYRKKKVSESFVRLLFFNSTDPLEQKLLFHSTVFLDSTALYGKYLKQMMYMEDANLTASAKNQNVAVLMCDDNTVSARVDTKMVITNEYDRTKSAEGFNLYLFAEDTNVNLDENGEKTIYMKVEFNHAGNGKTIPMIMWPKKDGNYVPLTVDNFIDSLYIPIKLTYFNGKYVYYIPDAYANRDGNISLVLFEPKLDYEDNSKIE